MVSSGQRSCISFRLVAITHKSVLSARLWFNSWESLVPVHRCICLKWPWIDTSDCRSLRKNTSINRHTPEKQFFAGGGNTINMVRTHSRWDALSTFVSGTHTFLGSDDLTLYVVSYASKLIKCVITSVWRRRRRWLGSAKQSDHLDFKISRVCPFWLSRHTHFWEATLVHLLCCTTCFGIYLFRIYTSFRANVTLTRFSKTFGLSRG